MIFEAIKNNDYELFKKLFYCIDITDNAILFHALCQRNINYKIIKFLFKHKFDINSENNYGYTTALHFVCSKNFKLVKYLIKKGANIYQISSFYETCLYGVRNLKILKYLVKKGLDINRVNGINETILFRTCYLHNLKLIKYIIKKNPNVNMINIYGGTVLYNACRNSDFVIVKYLIKKGLILKIIMKKHH